MIMLVAMVVAACGGDGFEDAVVQTDPTKVPTVAAAVADTADDASASGGTAWVSSNSSHSYGTSIQDWTPAQGEIDETGLLPGQSADYAGIDWEDLIPAGSSINDLYAIFEDRLQTVETGSAEAEELYNEVLGQYDPGTVNPDLEGQQIRLEGFVAPLTYDGDRVTEFLLVPNFGACIHVPPPPPNQTIMVALDTEGLTIDETYGAIWVEGVLAIDAATTDLAEASYTITNASTGVYYSS